MVQVKESRGVKGLMECHDLFSGMIGYLERGSATYVAKGCSLDEEVSASIGQLRTDGLSQLAQVVDAFARHSEVPHESPDYDPALVGMLNALDDFTKVTYALNIAFAGVYRAMPEKAKDLVPFKLAFDRLVEREPFYLDALMQSK